jgi:hypothetical protein
MALIELFYYMFNIAYYKVMVVNGKEKIKYITQKEPSNEDGSEFFIINAKLKMAWFKLNDRCFTDGKKFLMTVDINNAIPLVCENSKIVEGEGLITKVIKNQKFKIDDKYHIDKDSGIPIKMVEITFPPTLLYQNMEAHFVKKVLASPKNKWDWLVIPLIVLFIVIGVVFYIYLQSKGVNIT